jgi:hypothetical protein
VKNSHLINQFLKKYALDMRHRKRVKIFVPDNSEAGSRNLEFSVDDLRFTLILGSGEDGKIRLEIPVMGSVPSSIEEMKSLMTLNGILGPAFLAERESQILLTWARPPRFFDYSELCLAIEEMSQTKKELEANLLSRFGIDQTTLVTDSMKGISRLCLPRNREMADRIQEISEVYPEPLKTLWIRTISCDEPVEASFRSMELLGAVVRIMVFIAISSVEGGIPQHAAISRTLGRYSLREWFSLGEILAWKHEMGTGPGQAIRSIFERTRRSSQEQGISSLVDSMTEFEDMLLGNQKNEMDIPKIQTAFREHLENLCHFLKAMAPLFSNGSFEPRLSGGEPDILFRNSQGEKSLRPFLLPVSQGAARMALFNGWTKVAGRAQFVGIPGFERTRTKPGPILESLDPSRISENPGTEVAVLTGYHPSIAVMECGTIDPFQGEGSREKWVNLVSRDDAISRHSMITHVQRKASCVHFTSQNEKASHCLLSILEQLLPDGSRELPSSSDLWTIRDRICRQADNLLGTGKIRDEVVLSFHRPDLSEGLVQHIRGLAMRLPREFRIVTTSRKPIAGAFNRECPPLLPSAITRATTSLREVKPASREFMDRLMTNSRREGIAYCDWVIQEMGEGRLSPETPDNLPESIDEAISISLKHLVARKGGAGCRNLLAACSALGGKISSEDSLAITGEEPTGSMGDLLIELEPFLLLSGTWCTMLETPEITFIFGSLLKEQTDRIKKELRIGWESARGDNFKYISGLLDSMPSAEDDVEYLISMLSRRTRNEQLNFAEMQNAVNTVLTPRGANGITENIRAVDLIRMGEKCSEMFFRTELDRFMNSLEQLLEAAKMAIRLQSPLHKAAGCSRILVRLLSNQDFSELQLEIRNRWICLLCDSITHTLDDLRLNREGIELLGRIPSMLPPGDRTSALAWKILALLPFEVFSESGAHFSAFLDQTSLPNFQLPDAAAVNSARDFSESANAFAIIAAKNLRPEQIIQIWKTGHTLSKNPAFLTWAAPRICERDPVLAMQMAEAIPADIMSDFQNIRFRTVCDIAVGIAAGNLKRAMEILNGMEIKKRMWDLHARIYMVCDALLKIASTLGTNQRKSLVNQGVQLLENHISFEGSPLERVNLTDRMVKAMETMFEVDLRRGEELLNRTLALLDFSMGSSKYCEYLLRLSIIARQQGLPVQRELISRALKVLKSQRINRESELIGLLVSLSPEEACGCLEHIPPENRKEAYSALMDSMDPIRYRELGDIILRSILQIKERTDRILELFLFLRAAIPHSSRLCDSIMAALTPELKKGLPAGLERFSDIFDQAHPNSILYFPQILQKIQGVISPVALLRTFSRIFETNPMDARKNITLAMTLFEEAMKYELSQSTWFSRFDEIKSSVHPVERFMNLAAFTLKTIKRLEWEVPAQEFMNFIGLGASELTSQDLVSEIFKNPLPSEEEKKWGSSAFNSCLMEAKSLLARLAMEISHALRPDEAHAVIHEIKKLLKTPAGHFNGSERSRISRSLEIIVSRYPIDQEAMGILHNSTEFMDLPAIRILKNANPVPSGEFEEAVNFISGIVSMHPEDLLKIFRNIDSAEHTIRILLVRPFQEQEALFRVIKATKPTAIHEILAICTELFYSIHDGIDTQTTLETLQGISENLEISTLLNLLGTLFQAAERSRERIFILEQTTERAREDIRPFMNIFTYLHIAVKSRDRETTGKILDFIIQNYGSIDFWMEKLESTGIMPAAGLRQSLLIATKAISGLVSKK